MKKILIVSATQKSAEEFPNQPLYESLFLDTPIVDIRDDHALYTSKEFDVIVKTENKDRISIHYNKCIQFAIDNIDEYDTIIFAHDDVTIEDRLLFKKVAAGLVKHDIIGLAGGKNLKLDHPALWHLMCDQQSWSGAVAHPFEGGDKILVTTFGPSPQRCLLLDGLFLAVRVKSLKDSPKVKFDEEIPCIAHFYDLDFCLTANENGFKLSTWPIWAMHNSPGLTEYSEEFRGGALYFIDKWTNRK